MLLAVAALPLMYSCEDEVKYTPAEPVSGPQVFFSPDLASTIELSEDATSFEVGLLRADTSESVSFSISVSGETEKFDIPTAVSFAAGAESATLTIGYDPDDFEYEEYFEVTLSIPEEYSTPYGLADYTFSAGISAPWNSLGWCTYTDDFFTGVFGLDPETWEVEIEENGLYPGYFRLIYPYDEKYVWNDPGDWDTSQTYYLEIHAEDPDGVYIEYQNTGVDWGYGPIYVWSYADYYVVAGGYDFDYIKSLGYCGTYKDGVITFPTNALQTWMPEYADDGWWYGNSNGAFRVVMPGVVLADYSIEVDYVGKYTDTKNANYAIGEVTIVGEDVAYAHAALFEGKDGDAAVAAIKANEVDCVEITESGDVLFSCEETGNYTIAVVSYSESGEAQDSDYVTFRFEVGAVETWTLYGEGSYSYSGFLFSGDDPGLEIYQSDDDPTRFKIEHWGYDTDFVFEWDQDANEIYVEDQYTGYDYGAYGAVNIRDIQDYTSMAGILAYATKGYYEDGVFNFAVQYYCSGGSFGFGYETFTLDGYTPGPALADIPGTFTFYEFSAYYSSLYYAEYVIEASDDASKGNIMFTVFDDFDCDISNVYGTYDETTGTAEFELDQLFGTYSYIFWTYQLSFTTYYGSPAVFRFFKNGNIWGPFYGDYITEEMYENTTYDGDWDAYAFMFGWKENAEPSSIKPASASDKLQKHPAEPAKNELKKMNINVKSVPAVKEATSTTSYNFVPTVEVKANPSTLDKTQVKDNLQQASTSLR